MPCVVDQTTRCPPSSCYLSSQAEQPGALEQPIHEPLLKPVLRAARSPVIRPAASEAVGRVRIPAQLRTLTQRFGDKPPVHASSWVAQIRCIRALWTRKEGRSTRKQAARDQHILSAQPGRCAGGRSTRGRAWCQMSQSRFKRS
jgi:hypothetical protein